MKREPATGEELEDFIHRDLGGELRHVDAERRERTIPQGTIAERTALASSGMPEDLVKPMSPLDVVNVIAYLEG